MNRHACLSAVSERPSGSDNQENGARSFKEVGPDRLLLDEAGGALSIFGLPFLCAGIFMCLGALGAVPISNANHAAAYTWPLLVLMGLLFIAVGGTMVFGRAWTTIDATRREVVKGWRLLWPMQRSVHTVDGETMVSIGSESDDSRSTGRFPVLLRSSGGPASSYAASPITRRRAPVHPPLRGISGSSSKTRRPITRGG